MARSIKSLGNQSSSSEGVKKAQQEFVPKAPSRGAHLTGLPRYRHAHANGSAFVFDGCATSATDFSAMERQESTYLVSTGYRENGGHQDHTYKRQMMVQEEGAIAAERRGLQDEAVDRLYRLLRERDRAQALSDSQEAEEATTMRRALSLEDATPSFATAAAADPLLLQIDGPRVAERLDAEAAVIEAARTALRNRHAKPANDLSWREVAARKDAAAKRARAAHAQMKNTQIQTRADLPQAGRGSGSGGLSVLEERAYMRFLKEGPREGDGAFVPTPGVREARSVRATLGRTHHHQIAQAMWKRPQGRLNK
jgi:hypothetical protein